jgi:hypothetical protein
LIDRPIGVAGLPIAASPAIDEVVALISGVGDPSPATVSEAAVPTVVVIPRSLPSEHPPQHHEVGR